MSTAAATTALAAATTAATAAAATAASSASSASSAASSAASSSARARGAATHALVGRARGGRFEEAALEHGAQLDRLERVERVGIEEAIRSNQKQSQSISTNRTWSA